MFFIIVFCLFVSSPITSSILFTLNTCFKNNLLLNSNLKINVLFIIALLFPITYIIYIYIFFNDVIYNSYLFIKFALAPKGPIHSWKMPRCRVVSWHQTWIEFPVQRDRKIKSGTGLETETGRTKRNGKKK